MFSSQLKFSRFCFLVLFLTETGEAGTQQTACTRDEEETQRRIKEAALNIVAGTSHVKCFVIGTLNWAWCCNSGLLLLLSHVDGGGVITSGAFHLHTREITVELWHFGFGLT